MGDISGIKFHNFDKELLDIIDNNSNVTSYIINYLKSIPKDSTKDISSIIEENYVDHDYMIDYSHYYSRCFSDVPRFTKRVHFFNTDKNNLRKLFSNVLKTDQTEELLKERVDLINNIYLGFLVKKPSLQGTIGKTVLRKYPIYTKKSGDTRILNVSRKNYIHLFGITLELDSLPWQEQDNAVSACATIACWSALKGLEQKFNLSVSHAPSEITNLAYSNSFFNGAPKFPNSGLTIFQIISLFEKLNYDVTIFSFEEKYDKKIVPDILIAYLTYGIPIVATLNLISKNSIDYHTVVISGFRFDWIKNLILQLYVHDDQISPYNSVEFKGKNLLNWKNEWIGTDGIKSVKVTNFIIPHYSKIRMRFTDIHKQLLSFRADPKNKKNGESFMLLLRDIVDYKRELLYETLPYVNYSSDILSFLKGAYPKYIWIIRSMQGGDILYDNVYDATQQIVSDPLVVIGFEGFKEETD